MKAWKQVLQQKFAHATQLGCKNPVKQKRRWKKDLESAGNDAIAEICPDWKTNAEQRAIYNSICKEATRKKNPRPDWLRAKACAWLESISADSQNSIWYPHGAIRVAHELFLRGSTKFKTLINYLQKSTNPTFQELVQAHEQYEATMAPTSGWSCMGSLGYFFGIMCVYIIMTIPIVQVYMTVKMGSRCHRNALIMCR